MIPLHWIDNGIKEEYISFNTQNCVLGDNSRLLSDARIVNFQGNPNKIKIGNNCIIRGELLINEYGGKITIGNYSSVGEFSRIWSGEEIVIGNSVHISHNVNIMDCNTHAINHLERHEEYVQIFNEGNIKMKGNIASAPITIEDFVWISFNAAILKGVTIGKGAIVAANSLVTKNVEPFTLVGGNPAIKIKSLVE